MFAMTEEAHWEQEYERTYVPNTVADDHRDWHTLNGRYSCPWDCAWSDPYDEIEDEIAARLHIPDLFSPNYCGGLGQYGSRLENDTPLCAHHQAEYDIPAPF